MPRTALLILAFLLVPLMAQAQEEQPMMDPPPPVAMPPANTELQVRMNALETQLRNVTGQLERTQYQNAQIQQTLQRMNADIDGRFQMLERRTGAIEARPVVVAPAPAAPPAAVAPPPPSPTLTTPPMAPAPPAAPSTQGQTDAPPAAAMPPSKDSVLGTLSSSGAKAGDPQTLYDEAFQAMRQQRYDEAEVKFRDFLKNNPKHRLAENAKYWLSETYYVRGKYQDAAVNFGEGFQQFPAGPKAPDNLLKLAMSLGSLKKNPDACTTLAELKKRFPNASAIIKNRAEQEKKSLACT